ncbi:PpiC-type peptidyl-prolyl cis-trans isomerase [Rivularia sp. IAM M-261]|nr:PpiC-type peptidyl-prolyl cis-trans isomerase [Calothrix sp. PCC 7716]GJD18351.1 PpiC-type peptidyl-prolyl cis-trans isomerase [Rivularia sp. IAM M-261]
MLQAITVTSEDILHQIKLNYKVPEIIEQIVTRKIIESAANQEGIKIEVEELQKTADQIRGMNKLLSADDTWNWLKKHSLSLEDYEEIVHNTLLFSKLAAHLFTDKVKPYFFDHQLDYTGAAIYEIILDDQDVAWELYYAIKEEEMSFYDAAHQYTQDKELRRKGGYRGIVYRKDLKPEISAAVFAAKPSQMIKPIVTSKGIHLIFVEEFVQAKLDKILLSEIITLLFSQWLKQQIEQVEFTVNLD